MRKQGSNGFTLVELLVVLTIIALVSAAVVLAVPDPRGDLAAEAERFAARARAAGERAIMDNRPVALRVSPNGYAFQIRSQGAWAALAGKPFDPQVWGPDVQASVTALDGRSVFDTTGLADPMHVALRRGREQVDVEISAGGTVRVLR
jgi:general secretion pathway protein H